MVNTKHCSLKQLIYCYNNANFKTGFLSEKDNFLRYKVHAVRHTYVFNFYLSKIICKRPKVSSKPTHFLRLINNGKVFSSLVDMTCS